MSQGGETISVLETEELASVDTLDTDVGEDVVDDVVDDLGDEKEEEPEHETARETVARVLKEAKEETNGKDSAPNEAKPDKNKAPVQAADPTEVAAPSRFDAASKTLFNKLPPKLKKDVSSMISGFQGEYTKSHQKYIAATKEAQHVVEAVRPYLLAHPELQAQGYTESKLISGLIASHQNLTNPKTKHQAYVNLGRELGIDTTQIESEAPTQEGDITNHPQFQALQGQLNAVTSRIEQADGAQHQQVVSNIVSEMKLVQGETDASGNFLYPELHNDAFLEQAKPLVSALKRSLPELSYGDALKRAHATLTGSSPQSANPKVPQQNNIPERATSAAVSVRGKVSSPVSQGQSTGEFPEEALGSARDTVKWALSQLRGK